ncbi:MAG: hypothetical protein RSB39_06240 [Oscillospiraceae bacterium]
MKSIKIGAAKAFSDFPENLPQILSKSLCHCRHEPLSFQAERGILRHPP